MKMQILSFLLISFSTVSFAAKSVKRNLVSNVMGDYRPDFISLCDDTKIVNVTIDIALRQVLGLNEPLQQLQTNLWMRLWWNDCKLMWNETLYNGTKHFIINAEKLWVPDITLYDSAGDSFPEMEKFRPKVFSDGTVKYTFTTIVTSMCKVNVFQFPFDKQRCELTFGSWVYNGNQLNFFEKNPFGDLSIFQKNSEWDIIALPAERSVEEYGGIPFPKISYFIVMNRRPLFYVLNLLFPCILITGITFLGFILPVESGERVSLQVTVMLALSFFMLMISQNLPPSSDAVPIVGVHFALTMFIVGLSCLMTVMSINLHFRENVQVPKWTKEFILGKLGKLMCVNCKDIIDSSHKEAFGDIGSATSNSDLLDNNEETQQTTFGITNKSMGQVQISKNNGFSILEKMLYELHFIERHYRDRETAARNSSEWRAVAIVIDRFCLVVFITMTAIMTGLVFLLLAM